MKQNIILILFLFIVINLQSQRIYINSIPKCGTHLLKECIKRLTGRQIYNPSKDIVTIDELPRLNKNSVIVWHVKYSQKAHQVLRKNNFKGVFIYRDPRDQVVSAAFWCIKMPGLIEHFGLKRDKLDFNELLRRIILNVKQEYDSYLPWTKNKLFHSIKFEDLVGPMGNGSSVKQRNAISNICAHLRIGCTSQSINDCINNMYGNTGTFREGKIGGWKKYFTPHNKNLFKQVAGQLLIDLGYEKDLKW